MGPSPDSALGNQNGTSAVPVAGSQLHSLVLTIVDLHSNVLLCSLLREEVLEHSEGGQVVCSKLQ